MDTITDVVNKLAEELPVDVKRAVENFQMHKLAATQVVDDVGDLQKLSFYVGCKIAARQARWRPVCDGIIALQQLREE